MLIILIVVIPLLVGFTSEDSIDITKTGETMAILIILYWALKIIHFLVTTSYKEREAEELADKNELSLEQSLANLAGAALSEVQMTRAVLENNTSALEKLSISFDTIGESIAQQLSPILSDLRKLESQLAITNTPIKLYFKEGTDSEVSIMAEIIPEIGEDGAVKTVSVTVHELTLDTTIS